MTLYPLGGGFSLLTHLQVDEDGLHLVDSEHLLQGYHVVLHSGGEMR